MKSPKRYNGFTLIEILITIGIIAIMVIAAFLIFPQVSRQTRVKDAVSEIRLIGVNAMQSFSPAGAPPDFSNINTNIFIRAKIIPPARIQNNTYKSPLGVSGSFTEEFGSGVKAYGFKYRFDEAISETDCIAFADALSKTPVPGYVIMLQNNSNSGTLVCVDPSGKLPSGWTEQIQRQHIFNGCRNPNGGFSVKYGLTAWPGNALEFCGGSGA